MWNEYLNATNTKEVLDILAEKGAKARLIAGGTDLVLERKRGLHEGVEILVDVSRVPGYDQITLDDENRIHLGPTVTHNHCVASAVIRQYAPSLAEAAWEVGAPQIRNLGTIVGNLVTASPANDTISPLMAQEAELVLQSRDGERVVPLADFYTGVRKTVLKPNEMVREIVLPALTENQRASYQKLGLRKAQAISLVNASVLLTFAGSTVQKAAITLGAVAPTIIHAPEAEAYLGGRELTPETIAAAAEQAQNTSAPIDDVRGSASYRREMVRVLVKRGLEQIARGETSLPPEDPVLLWDQQGIEETGQELRSASIPGDTGIHTTINGKSYVFEGGYQKTLLDLVRQDAGLTGSKEGCGEGECGACTMFLDGKAVMACLVPAPRAHQARIVTIEGLKEGEKLHPVQETFITEGSVQCGFCTPGFVMSGAKLLEEKDHPSVEEIEEAISGNLCRCTGYFKIIKAIEKASQGAGE